MAQSTADRLAALNAKERQVSDSMIRLNTEKENLEKELKTLSKEAIERFGTDDIEVLRERFRKAESENTAKLDAYEKALEEVSSKLTALKNAGV